MLPISLVVFVLVQSSLANAEDSFHDGPDSFNYYPDDVLDWDYNDLEKRNNNNNFLRFGRSGRNFDEYDEDESPKMGKKNLKNDNFLRFGRSGHDRCLGLGEEMDKRSRDKGLYLRFGRSIQEKPTLKTRSKRETKPDKAPKRTDAYLRFGKSSNFMRFGRNYQNPSPPYPKSDERLLLANLKESDRLSPRQFEELKVPLNSPLALLLSQLVSRRQEQGQRWETTL